MTNEKTPNEHQIVIRDFTIEDYSTIAKINNAVDSDWPETVEILKEQDERRDPKCKYRRWIAEDEGGIAGTGYFVQPLEIYDPGRFHVIVQVHPDYQRKGIGGGLCDYVIEQLMRLEATCLRSYAYEDSLGGTTMLSHRGFVEYERLRESHLDIGAFDFSGNIGLEESLVRQGVNIMTLRELESDPDRDTKLHRLDWEVFQDVPGSQDLTQLDLAAYLQHAINSPKILPDGFFIAVDNGEYVGLCVFEADPGSESLVQGITGVKSSHRHKRIATAMKIRGIQFAKENGNSQIRTCNEVGNEAILAINERLGFVKQRTWIKYEKRIAST